MSSLTPQVGDYASEVVSVEMRSQPLTKGDLVAMLALAARYPRYTVSVVDLPYRLASPALQDPASGCVWLDGGELIAWAIWQPAWSELDFAVHPAHAANVASEILAWGSGRVGAAARENPEITAWWVGCRPDDPVRATALETAGFVREPWTKVRYERDLAGSVPSPAVPAGVTLRPLRGESEVEQYVAAHRAAFDSTRMTADWRRGTLSMPGHPPDLDLVAEAPDGRIAAFAVLWLGTLAGGVEAQFEPVGTRPEYRRLGLAHALLLEGMRRARAAGARRAAVETYSFSQEARALYGSLLPERGHETLYYRREL
jgi:mycothiol synthase